MQLLGLQPVADPDTDPRSGFCLVRLDEDAHGRRARPLLPKKQFQGAAPATNHKSVFFTFLFGVLKSLDGPSWKFSVFWVRLLQAELVKEGELHLLMREAAVLSQRKMPASFHFNSTEEHGCHLDGVGFTCVCTCTGTCSITPRWL